MSDFVDSPIGSEWIKTPPGYKGTGPGEYDGCKDGPFGGFPRTHSENGVPEKVLYGPVPKPSGESDHF